jgi:CubicO group peptidase (beta-lactamase class C family)
MSHAAKALTGLLVLGFGETQAAHGQLSADTAASVDKVFAAYNRTDSPGCALGLDRNGRRLYRRGYGMASLEQSAPWSENSVSESGSVAKQFTAGAIVHLALAGKIDLDAPVQKYVPELYDYGPPVTVRMLLHHTSGIRDMWTLFTLAGIPLGSRLITTDQALQMVYRQRELNFPPNSQYLYSNSGFLLLGEIVRRVSGKPLAEYSQDEFFRPLGMNHTQWRDDWNRVVPGRVTAYTSSPRGYRVDMPFMNVYGAGGLLTTVGDLLIWNEQLTHPSIGGKAWSDTLAHRGRLTTGRDIDYAFGLSVTKHRGEREISHGGATGGYRTFLARWPDRGLSLALLCNLGNINPDGLAHQVADVFLGGAPDSRASSAIASNGGSTTDLGKYTGRYRAPLTEDLLALSVADGKLMADFGIKVPLEPTGPNRFQAPIGSIEIVFEPGPDGKPVRVLMIGEDTARYEPVTVGPMSAAELTELAGTYYGPELDATYLVAVRNDRLGITVGGEPEVLVDRTGPLSFGSASRSVRFTRAKTGKIDGMLLFAGRVRNLRFTRR